MKHAEFDVTTLRLEADEAEILDDLLAIQGVLDAEVDIENERVAVAYDERVTSRVEVAIRLEQFGLLESGTISGVHAV